jgi:hypothetical protein
LIGHAKRVEKTAAGRFETERRSAAGNPELLLHETADIRKNQIRCGRADEHEVDVFGVEARILERDRRGAIGKIARCLIVGRDVSPLDSRARANPFVARVDQLIQSEIGNDTDGQVLAGAGYARIHSC